MKHLHGMRLGLKERHGDLPDDDTIDGSNKRMEET